jgi:hypothetical protein
MARNNYRRQQIQQRAKSIREQRASAGLTKGEEELVESWVEVINKAKKPQPIPEGKKLSKKQSLIKARKVKALKRHKKKQAPYEKRHKTQLAQIEAKKQYMESHKFTKKAALAHIRFGGKKKIFSAAISYRYAADLIDPDRPFDDDRAAFKHGALSTAIVSFTYIPERRFLMLHWWKDWKKKIEGPKYGYFNVPMDVYIELVRASSKGRYIYYNVRTSFPYVRMSEGGDIKKPPQKPKPVRDPTGEYFRRIQQGY